MGELRALLEREVPADSDRAQLAFGEPYDKVRPELRAIVDSFIAGERRVIAHGLNTLLCLPWLTKRGFSVQKTASTLRDCLFVWDTLLTEQNRFVIPCLDATGLWQDTLKAALRNLGAHADDAEVFIKHLFAGKSEARYTRFAEFWISLYCEYGQAGAEGKAAQPPAEDKSAAAGATTAAPASTEDTYELDVVADVWDALQRHLTRSQYAEHEEPPVTSSTGATVGAFFFLQIFPLGPVLVLVRHAWKDPGWSGRAALLVSVVGTALMLAGLYYGVYFPFFAWLFQSPRNLAGIVWLPHVYWIPFALLQVLYLLTSWAYGRKPPLGSPFLHRTLVEVTQEGEPVPDIQSLAQLTRRTEKEALARELLERRRRPVKASFCLGVPEFLQQHWHLLVAIVIAGLGTEIGMLQILGDKNSYDPAGLVAQPGFAPDTPYCHNQLCDRQFRGFQRWVNTADTALLGCTAGPNSLYTYQVPVYDSIRVACPGGCVDSPELQGTGPFFGPVCKAAIFAGLIPADTGGVFDLIRVPPVDLLGGSQNGITTFPSRNIPSNAFQVTEIGRPTGTQTHSNRKCDGVPFYLQSFAPSTSSATRR